MITKISNIATQKEIEEYLDKPYSHGHLYRPRVWINGKEEVLVSVVNSEAPTKIDFAIWGILPQDFHGEWSFFQNIEDTLNTDVDAITENHWLYKTMGKRRCYIIVSGYFSFMVKKDQLVPIFSKNASENIFFLAGVYNKTEDGFFTCTLLVKKTSYFHTKNSFTPLLPIALSHKECEEWLHNCNSPINCLEFLKNVRPIHMEQHFISNIILGKQKKTKQMLKPVEYTALK